MSFLWPYIYSGVAVEDRAMMILRIFLLCVALQLLTGCTGMFFTPGREFVNDGAVLDLHPQDVYFRSSDGVKLHGWFLDSPRDCGKILLMHGNVENISTHVRINLWLVREGFDLFIFDYRGYGRSEGEAEVDGLHRDAEAALEKFLSMPGVGKEKIIVLGQSLGGAIAVYTLANSAYKDRVRLLVIDSAFSGYRMIAREKMMETSVLAWPFKYPLSLLVQDHYSPVRWIKKVSPVPILILHGQQDDIVPVRHGSILFGAAPEPKQFWLTTMPGHVQSLSDDGVRERFLEFVDAALRQP